MNTAKASSAFLLQNSFFAKFDILLFLFFMFCLYKIMKLVVSSFTKLSYKFKQRCLAS